jgi:hypothetical protein
MTDRTPTALDRDAFDSFVFGPRALSVNDVDDYIEMATDDTGKLDYEALTRRLNEHFGYWRRDRLMELARFWEARYKQKFGGRFD